MNRPASFDYPQLLACGHGEMFGPAIDSGVFPAFSRVVGTPFDFDLDEVFEFGLQRLLDGYAALFR